jgi:hypothetical protein
MVDANTCLVVFHFDGDWGPCYERVGNVDWAFGDYFVNIVGDDFIFMCA